MEKRFCGQCGNRHEPEDRFCRYCGCFLSAGTPDKGADFGKSEALLSAEQSQLEAMEERKQLEKQKQIEEQEELKKYQELLADRSETMTPQGLSEPALRNMLRQTVMYGLAMHRLFK